MKNKILIYDITRWYYDWYAVVLAIFQHFHKKNIKLLNYSPQNGTSFSHPLIGSHLIVFGPNISYPESHSYVASDNPLFGPALVWTLEFAGTAGGPHTVKKKKLFISHLINYNN